MSTTRICVAAMCGTVAATLLTMTPVAGASCISAFSISSSPDCSTGVLSIAIAQGDGAKASAYGWGTFALANGTGATAAVPARFALTILDTAIANGDQSGAYSYGILGIAYTDGFRGHTSTDGVANIAINRGDHADYNWAETFGVGNVAVNWEGDGRVVAGFDQSSYASLAFNRGGTNTVKTTGLLAVAGSDGQDGSTVVQNGPGVNINNNAAAALRQATTQLTKTQPRSQSLAATTRSLRTASATASASVRRLVDRTRAALGSTHTAP